MSIGLFGDEIADRVMCSRAACSLDATAAIEWRNPKIHSEDRKKVWLACDEHLEYLHGFLSARNFPTMVVPVDRQDPQSAEGGVSEPG